MKTITRKRVVKIGRMNKLSIKRELEYVVHLDGGEAGEITLPNKYVPENSCIGDEVEVFVYMDKDDRLRAIGEKPYATVGQFAKLRVAAISSSGAYLDWGLQKDLLVPKREQLVKMVEGKSYVVFVFLDDKTKRIAASSKLDKFLGFEPPNYAEGDKVDLLICEKTDLGFKAIVDNLHWGVIYKNEIFQKLHVGLQLKGYIKKVRDDLKIDLRLQGSGQKGVGDVTQNILNIINESGGSISITDKSPPDEISAMFGISKKLFKKAIGALYKRSLISIEPDCIKTVKK
jgi:predicted RNA-binding protein (virulence factor B family)